MRYNRIILGSLINLFILLIFFNSLKADSRICGNDLTNYIYKYHPDKFEYLEERYDSGIFFDFTWDKNNKKIITKRNNNNYPIVKFSFFENEKIKPGKTAIKFFNSFDLSKLNDEQLEKLLKKSGKINLELVNGEKIQIISKFYKLNDFKLSDFEIISIQNIDSIKGILEMSFEAYFTNVRNDLLTTANKVKDELDPEILNNFSQVDICDDLKPYLTWPLSSLEFDEFRYDADVREGLKNKEKLMNPVFEITYDNNELRTLRTEKGVGFFRQDFDFKKFPFDTQKLIVSISTGTNNIENVTFLTPSVGAFLNVEKFIKPEINKLKAWEIKNIDIKNRVIQDDKNDIYNKKIISISQNYLDIEIIIERNSQHYLFKVMLPVFLILCVAWYVLWIPTQKYEARLNTSIISLLALIAYNFVFQDDIPKLEYLTDLDRFILLSYIFCCIPVFSSIAFSKFISTKQRKVEKVNEFIKIWGGLLYCLITIQIFFYK
jgi:hypothetical protein|tara:strand:+ start:306 stop:1775 length:1470 start_codon:yes stop_codon:yes gene_type:complete